VTSSVTVLQALLWEKLSACDKIAIKNLENRRIDEKQILRDFFLNLKDDLRMKFIV